MIVPTGMLEIGRLLPGRTSSLRAGGDHIANPEFQRGDDVTFLAIHIVEQRQTGRPVGIVFNRSHFGRDPMLFPFKIHHPQISPAAAAAMAHGDPAMDIPAAMLLATA